MGRCVMNCHELSFGVRFTLSRHSDRGSPRDCGVEESRRRRLALVRQAESRSLRSLRSAGMTAERSGGDGDLRCLEMSWFVFRYTTPPPVIPTGAGRKARGVEESRRRRLALVRQAEPRSLHSLRSVGTTAERSGGDGDLRCLEMSWFVFRYTTPPPVIPTGAGRKARGVEESRRRRLALVRQAEPRSLHSLRSVGTTAERSGGDGDLRRHEMS